MVANPATRVLVAGAGVAGLETVLALQALAPERFAIEVLAPERHFTYRPPGALFERAAPARVELAEIARDRGFELTRDALETVDAEAHEVLTQDGAKLPYDVLVLALGMQPIAAVDGAIPYRGWRDVTAVLDALDTLDAACGRVAYIARSDVMWTLPAYELALHTAAWARRKGNPAEVLLATAEHAPVEAFGAQASARVAELLSHAGVRLLAGIVVERVHEGSMRIQGVAPIAVDLAVALPFLAGPAVPGVPHDVAGFTPVDDTGRVRGVANVYAVGGMTDRPLKHGGLGTQQAAVTASAIAAAAGVPVRVAPYRPVLRGILRNGASSVYLRHPEEDSDLLATDSGVGALHLSRYLSEHRGLPTLP